MALTARSSCTQCMLPTWRRSAQARVLRTAAAQPVYRRPLLTQAVRGTSYDASSSAKDAQLAAAWQRNSTLLSAGGSLGLSQQDPLHVFHITQNAEGTSAAGLLTFPLADGSSASSVQQLVDAAVPSPFGKGKETVYDPAVRAAAEIKAAQLALSKALPPPEVLEEVRALLQPSASSVVAELDKLNVYGPGGFFKPHYNTPRSPDHFGTLIMCLPSPFKGGQLLLRHVDHSSSSSAPLTKTYDWSASSSSDDMPQALQWAAFYADTEHEVLPVTEGHRVTLTYNLRALQKQQWPAPVPEPGAESSEDEAEKGSDTPEKQADQQQEGASSSSSSSSDSSSWITPVDASAAAELTADIKQLLADKDWHSSGERLGFVLQQKYSAGLGDLAALSFPEALKGPDRLLAAALQKAGLETQCELAPWVVPLFRGYTGFACEWDYQEPDAYQDDKARRSRRRRRKARVNAKQPETNFGRPLQPAQRQEPLTTQPSAYWALLVAEFGTCSDTLNRGYMEDKYYFRSSDSKTASALQEAFGAREENIAWVTPVRDEHFSYHSSVLAGANHACEVCFPATAALLVDVPSWADRQALLAADAT